MSAPGGLRTQTPTGASPLTPLGDFRPQTPSLVESKNILKLYYAPRVRPGSLYVYLRKSTGIAGVMFLQAGHPFWHSSNSVKALKDKSVETDNSCETSLETTENKQHEQ